MTKFHFILWKQPRMHIRDTGMPIKSTKSSVEKEGFKLLTRVDTRYIQSVAIELRQ